jgi:hypothetical protein
VAHVDDAVAALQVAFEKPSVERRTARTVHLEVRRNNSLFHRRHGDNDLERRSGRVPTLDDAVLERAQLVGVERAPRRAIDAGRKVVRVEGRQADERQHVAVVRIEDERGAVEAGVTETVFGGLLKIVVDRELHAAPLDGGHAIELTDFTARAVHHDDLRAVTAHQELVVDPLDPHLAHDRAARNAIAHLRLRSLAHVAEQVRGQCVGRVLTGGYFLDDDVRQLEVEPPGRDCRDLRERRIFDDHDRPIAWLPAMTVDDLPHAPLVESGNRRQQPDRAVDILRVLANDGDVERVAVLDENLAVAVEQHAPRRPQGERPLVIVLRHLTVVVVLDDLEEPEAHCQRREHDNGTDLEDRKADPDASAIFGDGHATTFS